MQIQSTMHPGLRETPDSVEPLHAHTHHIRIKIGGVHMPDDLIPLKEASKLIGRSVDTLRRWKRQGTIDFHQNPDDKSKLYVSRGAVLQATSVKVAPVEPVPAVAPAATKSAELDAIKAHLEDVRTERDSWKTEVKRLQVELTDVRTRLATVERELNGGVRGLLRGVLRR